MSKHNPVIWAYIISNLSFLLKYKSQPFILAWHFQTKRTVCLPKAVHEGKGRKREGGEEELQSSALRTHTDEHVVKMRDFLTCCDA